MTSLHEENKFWLMDMLCFGAIFQLKDAEAMALFLNLIELECDHSCHPESGPRDQFDDNLKLVDRAIITSFGVMMGSHLQWSKRNVR